MAHACADALLGPAGLGDIGSRFPDTDAAHAGADSMLLLATVVSEVSAAGWQPINIDCSVVAETQSLRLVELRWRRRLPPLSARP